MINCKHCGATIASSAKSCPQCGGKNKKPVYKRVWFIVLCVIILIAVIGNLGGNDTSTNTNNNNATVDTPTITQSQQDSEPKIEYTAYTVAQMKDDLDNNALKAAEKYNKQYVEITGRLNVIDSSGKYISIVSVNDQWAIIGVQCYIKNDEQKKQIMEMSIGDTMTIRGKITAVGEVMGYSLDIAEIVK